MTWSEQDILQIFRCVNVAKQGKRVAVFSMEMSGVEVPERLTTNEIEIALTCAGYLVHPSVFFDFRQKFPSADFSFSPKVGSVYFLNTHWDHLGDRF